MSESRDAISKLILTYAERVDHGDFEGVGALFEQSTYRSVLGDDVVTYTGSEAVQSTMETMVRRYDDGTPRTKHVTTNLMIDVDDGAGTATAKSYFTVLQQVDDLPLQVIIAGRYHDRFERVAGEWQFADRLIFSDLIGDLSHHLTTDPYA
jgi:3-phenylpropionate/cinnamic acid dioxygenase small subunit